MALHRCLLRCTVGSTGAEELRPGHLTCSLNSSMVLAPVHHLGTVGSTGATWLCHLAPFIADQMHRWQGTSVSEANRLDRCLVTGATGATDFCRTRLIQRFFEFFLRVLFCLAFFASSLGFRSVHLTNLLVPLIALLLNHQNHKTMT